MEIKVLGSGCCDKGSGALAALVTETLTELGLTAEVSQVDDTATVIGYGVMSTPALVIDDQVVAAGRVPSKAQVTELLTAAGAR